VSLALPADPSAPSREDDLGRLVGKMGGRILVIPAEQMPVQAGLTAINRY
jgi:hypothetical protein